MWRTDGSLENTAQFSDVVIEDYDSQPFALGAYAAIAQRPAAGNSYILKHIDPSALTPLATNVAALRQIGSHLYFPPMVPVRKFGKAITRAREIS